MNPAPLTTFSVATPAAYTATLAVRHRPVWPLGLWYENATQSEISPHSTSHFASVVDVRDRVAVDPTANTLASSIKLNWSGGVRMSRPSCPENWDSSSRAAVSADETFRQSSLAPAVPAPTTPNANVENSCVHARSALRRNLVSWSSHCDRAPFSRIACSAQT